MNFNKTLLFLLLLLSAGYCSAAEKTVIKDGTFLLRSRQKELDYQLKKQFLQNPALRHSLKNRRNLIVNESEVGFQVYNFISGLYQYKPGILVAEGQYCRVFIEMARAGIWGESRDVVLQQIVSNFDQHVYPTVTAWFGEPAVPPEFYLPDEKIFIFLVDIEDNFSDGYVAGYFDHRDIEGLFGNQKPVFFMDINPGKPGIASDKANPFYRTLAHEFQHMVSFSRRLQMKLPAQERWLDEGLSMFSEFVYSGRVGENSECLPPSPHYEKFVESPLVNLFSSSNNSWFKEDQLFRQYGASFLFATYLIEKYGGESTFARQGFVKKLIEASDSGCTGLNEFLRAYDTSLLEVFQNWTLACYLNDASLNQGKWHFASLKVYDNAQVSQLPLKHVTHFYARAESSFVGGEGTVVPNTVNLEEIKGDARVKIKYLFEKTMTPALVALDENGAVKWQHLSADAPSTLDIDLSQQKRLFILPQAVKFEFAADEALKFSYNSETSGLMLYPVANPAFSDQFIIFLRSSQRPLVATPTLRISLNNLVDSPAFVAVDDERRIFAAHYRLPGNGRGQATCYAGEDSCSFSFSAAAVMGNELALSSTGNASLVLGSADQNRATAAMLSAAPIEFGGLQGDIVAGPYQITLHENSSATLLLDKVETQSGLGLAELGPWQNCISWQQVALASGAVSAKIPHSGRFCLVKDKQAPVLESLIVKSAGDKNLIELKLRDDLSGIDKESLRLSLEQTGPVYPISSSDNRFVYLMPTLPAGEHQLHLEVKDLAGNLLTETRHQVLAGKISLTGCEIFPNPCRGRARLRYQFSAPVNLLSASIKIYDVSGELVAEPDLLQVSKTLLEAGWSGLNKSQKRAANGVYLVKTRISTSQGNFKTTAKLALLR